MQSVSQRRSHSLILQQEFTSGTNYELYGGRSLANYDYLIFEAISGGYIRASIIVMCNDFKNASEGVFLNIFHGALDSETGLYPSMSRLVFKYIDNTHITVYTDGKQAVKTGTVIGFKFQ